MRNFRHVIMLFVLVTVASCARETVYKEYEVEPVHETVPVTVPNETVIIEHPHHHHEHVIREHVYIE